MIRKILFEPKQQGGRGSAGRKHYKETTSTRQQQQTLPPATSPMKHRRTSGKANNASSMADHRALAFQRCHYWFAKKLYASSFLMVSFFCLVVLYKQHVETIRINSLLLSFSLQANHDSTINLPSSTSPSNQTAVIALSRQGEGLTMAMTSTVATINRANDVSNYYPSLPSSTTILSTTRHTNITSPVDENLLRLDYTNLTYTSKIAKLMYNHQTNCDLPLGNFIYRNRFGLGSDLHVYGQALCNSMEVGVRLRTVVEPNWIYWDQETCLSMTSDTDSSSSATSSLLSPMLCYFPQSELQCGAKDLDTAREHPKFDPSPIFFQNISKPNGRIGKKCDSFMVRNNLTLHELRIAGIEYLFGRISPLVMQEANRQLARVFRFDTQYHDNTTGATTPAAVAASHRGGASGQDTQTMMSTPQTTPRQQNRPTTVQRHQVPKDLITVHIRWGDKVDEMKLAPMVEYIAAIKRILKEKPRKEINILLATEDPMAVHEFHDLTLNYTNWNIYIDQYYYDMLPYRINEYNGNPKMSKLLKGKAGLLALSSILVCMEANDYILTTSSNWSRIINEIRLSIINPRCNNCTSMIDLRPIGNKEW